MENEKKMICGANGKACECKGGCFACKIGEEFRAKFGAALADERLRKRNRRGKRPAMIGKMARK